MSRHFQHIYETIKASVELRMIYFYIVRFYRLRKIEEILQASG